MVFKEFLELFRVFLGGVPDAVCTEGGPDTAVILGAQVLKGGRPSPALEARVRHGAALYKKGVVGLLIPTGGLGEYPPPEARLMRDILRGEGVPENVVVLEEKAVNTWGSAVLVSEICHGRGIERVRVVSDPLHCVRTVWAFRKAGLDACAEPAYENPMWLKPLSRGSQFVREFGALAWYKIRYRAG